MAQITMVNEQVESGKRLMDALLTEGFEVSTAFWAWPTDEGKGYLYLASPQLEEKGLAASYRLVHRVLRTSPELWIDPLDIRLINPKDSIACAAADVTRPRIPDSPFAVRNPRPYPGMTRFGGSNLGGLDIDGAYIYPPSITATPR